MVSAGHGISYGGNALLAKEYERLIGLVEKPSRYIGGEINTVIKSKEEKVSRFGFLFPDVYEVGMSHLGMHILYQLINTMPDWACERVFSPWADMEAQLRNAGLPLITLETGTALSELEMLGVTLQYELSYSNILNALDLGGIPLKSSDRGCEHPIVMAGGPCAYNPEPLADFIDLFALGEGEEMMPELLSLYSEMDGRQNRRAFLEAAAGIEGIYVPSLYDVTYNEDGTIKAFTSCHPNAKSKVKKRILADMDAAYYPEKVIVPFTDIVHDRAMVEIFRGCTRGCRFCQAGMLYRPNRERTPEKIMELADMLLESTGYEELSLTSLSTCDYSAIRQLVQDLIKRQEANQVSLSLPSLRIDEFPGDIVRELQKIKKTGLTFAPEAGTQRMRDVINKGVTEEDLEKTLTEIFRSGWDKVKLYFMIGLPTETLEDVAGIAAMGQRAVDLFYKIPKGERASGVSITLSASSFVPKPFTPFQWEPQDTMEQLREKQQHLKVRNANKKVRFSYHSADVSFMEGVFARGDRRLGAVLLRAWELGAKFDGWDEFFKFDIWMQAFNELGIDPAFYANRRRSMEEILPWDHIDPGVSKAYLIEEYQRAVHGEITPDCRAGCTGCGITSAFGGGVCSVQTKN